MRRVGFGSSSGRGLGGSRCGLAEPGLCPSPRQPLRALGRGRAAAVGFGLPWTPGASSLPSLFPCPWENPAWRREGWILKRGCDKRGSEYHLVSHFHVLFGNAFFPLGFFFFNFLLVEFAVDAPLAGLFAGTGWGSTNKITLLTFCCCQHLGLGWRCWRRLCCISFIWLTRCPAAAPHSSPVNASISMN